MTTKQCIQCGRIFQTATKNAKAVKFCPECREKANKERNIRYYDKYRKGAVTKACPICGKTFVVEGKKIQAKYCSDECKYTAQRQRYNERRDSINELKRVLPRENKCLLCGKTFIQTKPRESYCSDDCRYARKITIAEECAKKRQPKKSRTEIALQKEKKAKKTRETIKDINAKALEKHMSYGQYVALYGV